MMRALAVAALLLAAGPLNAATRDVMVGSFDRVRVSGPFEVRIAVGPPRARVEGEAAALDGVEVDAEGDTLTVRARATDAGPRPGPAVITLTSPTLRSVAVSGGARVAAERVGGERVDLAVNGSGTLNVAAADAIDLTATVIGAGSIGIAGKAARVRLLTNGPGGIDAAGLEADALTVRLDGPGETRARARYTASVENTGAGSVAVAGNATCTIRAAAGGPVACGRAPTP